MVNLYHIDCFLKLTGSGETLGLRSRHVINTYFFNVLCYVYMLDKGSFINTNTIYPGLIVVL